MNALRQQFGRPNWRRRPFGDTHRPELAAAKQALARATRQQPVGKLAPGATSAASRCMNSCGANTKCVVASRQSVFSFVTTCPAALHCARALVIAGRVI
jgi:hypothetical protein